MMQPSPPAELAARPLDSELLQRWPLPVDADGDKFSRGTILIVGGSPMTPGAVILAGLAALRMGAGRLQIATAAGVATAVGVATPEALVVPVETASSGELTATENLDVDRRIAAADAILVGPGLVTGPFAVDVVTNVLSRCRDDARVVLDAAALRALPDVDAPLLERVRGRLALTPNHQEAAALAGDGGSAEVLEEAARRFGAVVTSFGRVQAPDGRRWEVGANNPGLGTSGSGDVLAGLVAGAAARTDDIACATCWATFAHSAAGARAAASTATLGYLARELLAEVPACLPQCQRVA